MSLNPAFRPSNIAPAPGHPAARADAFGSAFRAVSVRGKGKASVAPSAVLDFKECAS
ncbi:hypothetical protein [Rhizobium sp. AN80A]|uniref:hypothetical protein n=1 Tax=Rhizobium sp. AN80A TaxID=3040673 RepID=UPI0024B33802|nr:hypothetical protein [Rhizobium sp. AN80A]